MWYRTGGKKLSAEKLIACKMWTVKFSWNPGARTTKSPMFQSRAKAAAQAETRLRSRPDRRQSRKKRYRRMLKSATPVQCHSVLPRMGPHIVITNRACLLYTSDAADERSSVDLGGRRII